MQVCPASIKLYVEQAFMSIVPTLNKEIQKRLMGSIDAFGVPNNHLDPLVFGATDPGPLRWGGWGVELRVDLQHLVGLSTLHVDKFELVDDCPLTFTSIAVGGRMQLGVKHLVLTSRLSETVSQFTDVYQSTIDDVVVQVQVRVRLQVDPAGNLVISQLDVQDLTWTIGSFDVFGLFSPQPSPSSSPPYPVFLSNVGQTINNIVKGQTSAPQIKTLVLNTLSSTIQQQIPTLNKIILDAQQLFFKTMSSAVI
eukprot:GILJ01017527.1.p1 GENE.GILJ01017527.1~~GILJ01017527.1.p1  ORF type:complete len:252 (+),score=33.33 GILJ01017527.1:95-850(+)